MPQVLQFIVVGWLVGFWDYLHQIKLTEFLLVQGGIDEGEDPKSAALRELKEETGITSAQVVAEV